MQAAADSSSQTTITNLNNVVGVFNPFITSNELYTGFYTKGQTNTLLNAKENVLTFNAPLTRNTNTIGIDLSSYLTTSAASSTYQPILSFSAPMTKTGNNVTIDLSSYATTASLNNYMTSNATSNIFLTIANASATYATISSLVPYMTSNATSNIFLTQASAAATYATITNLNLKENILTFSSPLTRSTNAIGIDLSAYSTTTTNNSTYLRLSGGQMSGTIGFGTAQSASVLINCYNASSTAFQNIQMINNANDFFYFGIAGNAVTNGSYLNNFFIQASKGLVFNSMNKTHTSTFPDLIITNNSVGINISTPSSNYKLDVNGNINGLTLFESGTSLASKYALSTSLANYVLKTGDTMSGALTVNGNINITSSGTNKLIFDNAFNNKKIELNSNAGLGAGNVDLTFYSAGTFTFRNTALSTTLFSIDDSGSLSFNGRVFPARGLYTDNVLTSTSNIIGSNLVEGGQSLNIRYASIGSLGNYVLKAGDTMTGNLTTSGTISAASFTEGGVSLASKYITSASLDTTYLRLNGANSMTGNLGVGTAAQATTTATIFTAASSSNTGLMIRTNATTTGASLLLNNNIDQSATIALVATNFPASYLSSNLWIKSPRHIHLSVDNLVTSAALSILANGNTGIGTTNPTSKLCINPNPVYGGVFNFATCPCIITNPTPSSASALNDPQPVLHLCREGTFLQSYGQRISFYLSRYENIALNSRTRCDIVLAENEFLDRTVMTLLSSGNIGIGKTNPNCRLYIDSGNGNTVSQSYSLRIGSSGTISDSGAFANLIGLGIEANGWSKGAIGWVRRGGWDQGDMVFLARNTGDSADADLSYERMRITGTGRVGINTSSPNCQFTVVGIANINNGSPYATANGTMASGSLTIGGLNVNYGGGNQWTTNTAGFMMECQDNTEIMIHDSGNRLASFMRYVGAGTNQFYIGRDAGWGTIAQTNFFGNVYLNNSLFLKTDVWNYSTDNKERIYFANNGITYFRAYNNGGVPQTNCYVFRNNGGTDIIGINDNGNTFFVGEISAKFTTISGSYRDLLGCYVEGTVPGNSGNYTAYLIQGTFTGIHRVFTEDPLFIKEEPQKFKDDYEGRIVIANGKIATDTNEDKDVWEIKYEKDGITIEDALPMIELSRKKKDKRVFGVLGAPKRQTNRPERLIINSVGEGAIWVCNSNGNIENGDFIQSSAYLGYGERQDDDLFHNYTVGKITIDCNFILDSPLYQCKEIDDLDENGNKLRVAFVSCVYHCG
jgi:hypothetical protein